MTLIPWKDDIENYESIKKVVPPPKKVNKWVEMADETNFLEGLFVLFVYFTIMMNIFSMPTLLYGAEPSGIACPPLTIFCDVILGVCVIIALINAGGFNFILQCIISFVGGFAEPSNVTFEELEEDRRRGAQKLQETADRCAQMWDKVNSANKPSDGKDFNTRQKAARKQKAYESADPEFIVDYKSVGGAWVRDIVRGRDKGEVLARFRKSPTVQYMGGVMGIYE